MSNSSTQILDIPGEHLVGIMKEPGMIRVVIDDPVGRKAHIPENRIERLDPDGIWVWIGDFNIGQQTLIEILTACLGQPRSFRPANMVQHEPEHDYVIGCA